MKRMYVEETLLIKNEFEPEEAWVLDNFDDYSYFKVQVGEKHFEYYVNESDIVNQTRFVSDNGKIEILFAPNTKIIEVYSELGTVGINYGIIIKGVKY